jgi:hypothetical protein
MHKRPWRPGPGDADSGLSGRRVACGRERAAGPHSQLHGVFDPGRGGSPRGRDDQTAAHEYSRNIAPSSTMWPRSCSSARPSSARSSSSCSRQERGRGLPRHAAVGSPQHTATEAPAPRRSATDTAPVRAAARAGTDVGLRSTASDHVARAHRRWISRSSESRASFEWEAGPNCLGIEPHGRGCTARRRWPA